MTFLQAFTELGFKWTIKQTALAKTVFDKCHREGDLTADEAKAVLMGMAIAGPLGIGCPDWRITALTMHIAAGPPITKTGDRLQR